METRVHSYSGIGDKMLEFRNHPEKDGEIKQRHSCAQK